MHFGQFGKFILHSSTIIAESNNNYIKLYLEGEWMTNYYFLASGMIRSTLNPTCLTTIDLHALLNYLLSLSQLEQSLHKNNLTTDRHVLNLLAVVVEPRYHICRYH